jgi:hypothetical protein
MILGHKVKNIGLELVNEGCERLPVLLNSHKIPTNADTIPFFFVYPELKE